MIKSGVQELAQGLWTLLFPQLCLNCRRSVALRQEPSLCVTCFNRLAPTKHWELPENELTDRLKGRLPLQFGAALYYFNDGNVCQSLIHALKYYHRPEIGEQLGRLFADYLKCHTELQDLAGIVPIPIHPERRHKRGYNQAEYIADGLATGLAVPTFPDALIRTSFKGSQTKMDRLGRLENVRNSFAIGKGEFAGKHLLLVDDVITTGATLDFCGNLLLEHHQGSKVSIVTLALAS
ncbi:MAG: phosphoribosyltransferase family protein [Bacteroidota bacterium]